MSKALSSVSKSNISPISAVLVLENTRVHVCFPYSYNEIPCIETLVD